MDEQEQRMVGLAVWSLLFAMLVFLVIVITFLVFRPDKHRRSDYPQSPSVTAMAPR